MCCGGRIVGGPQRAEQVGRQTERMGARARANQLQEWRQPCRGHGPRWARWGPAGAPGRPEGSPRGPAGRVGTSRSQPSPSPTEKGGRARAARARERERKAEEGRTRRRAGNGVRNTGLPASSWGVRRPRTARPERAGRGPGGGPRGGEAPAGRAQSPPRPAAEAGSGAEAKAPLLRRRERPRRAQRRAMGAARRPRPAPAGPLLLLWLLSRLSPGSASPRLLEHPAHVCSQQVMPRRSAAAPRGGKRGGPEARATQRTPWGSRARWEARCGGARGLRCALHNPSRVLGGSRRDASARPHNLGKATEAGAGGKPAG